MEVTYWPGREFWGRGLTTPETIKQYRFGMSVESKWKVGSTWRMYADGSLMDSGEILVGVSQKRLVMSWLNEWKPEFKAEGNSRCVYEIEPTGRPRSSHSPSRLNGRILGSSEPSRRAGRWSYRISSRCLKRGMLLSSIIVAPRSVVTTPPNHAVQRTADRPYAQRREHSHVISSSRGG